MSDRVLEEIAALKDEDWALREEAATLLGEFRDPRAVGPLVEALHDEDRAVREAATTALRKIGPPAAPALIVALQDPNGNVQEAAVAILKDVATPEAVEPLIGCPTSEHTTGTWRAGIARRRRSAASVTRRRSNPWTQRSRISRSDPTWWTRWASSRTRGPSRD